MNGITDFSKFPTVDNKITPLMEAIISNAPVSEILEIFMQGGKDTINARSNEGRTAMNYAIRQGNYLVCYLLMRHGGLDLDEHSKDVKIPVNGGEASAAHSDWPLKNSARSAPSVACPYLQDLKLQAYFNNPAYLQGQGNITNKSVTDTDMMYLDKFCDHISDDQGQEDRSTSFIPTPDSSEISRLSDLPTQTRPTDELPGTVHREDFNILADLIKISLDSSGIMYDRFPGRSFIKRNTEHVTTPEKPLGHKTQEQGSSLSNDEDCNTKNSDNPTENLTTLENAKVSARAVPSWESLVEAVIIHQLSK